MPLDQLGHGVVDADGWTHEWARVPSARGTATRLKYPSSIKNGTTRMAGAVMRASASATGGWPLSNADLDLGKVVRRAQRVGVPSQRRASVRIARRSVADQQQSVIRAERLSSTTRR